MVFTVIPIVKDLIIELKALEVLDIDLVKPLALRIVTIHTLPNPTSIAAYPTLSTLIR
jgi:hypothetical protein